MKTYIVIESYPVVDVGLTFRHYDIVYVTDSMRYAYEYLDNTNPIHENAQRYVVNLVERGNGIV